MRAAPVRRDKRDTSATQVKKFDFDNDTSEKIFSFYERFSFFLKKKTYNPWFCKFSSKKYTMDENYEKLSIRNLNI